MRDLSHDRNGTIQACRYHKFGLVCRCNLEHSFWIERIRAHVEVCYLCCRWRSEIIDQNGAISPTLQVLDERFMGIGTTKYES